MELIIDNNHLLVEMDTDKGRKTCMLATSSPFTFFYDDTSVVYHQGEPHRAAPLSEAAERNIPKREVRKFISRNVDGYIGSDFMKKWGEVLLDMRNRTVTFGTAGVKMDHTVAMNPMLGIPTFRAEFNGRELLTSFDPSIMYSFVHSRVAHELAFMSGYATAKDFRSGQGEFEIALYKGSINVAGVDLGVCNIGVAEKYDEAMKLFGIDACVGVDALKDSALLFSYVDNLVGIEHFAQ